MVCSGISTCPAGRFTCPGWANGQKDMSRPAQYSRLVREWLNSNWNLLQFLIPFLKMLYSHCSTIGTDWKENTRSSGDARREITCWHQAEGSSAWCQQVISRRAGIFLLYHTYLWNKQQVMSINLTTWSTMQYHVVVDIKYGIKVFINYGPVVWNGAIYEKFITNLFCNF